MDWLNRSATLAIAIAGIAIAWAQLWIANIRLTHDLFDRRYAIYAAARKFIQEICKKHTVTIEERSSFYYASADAIFVLDEGLAAYLAKLRTKAAKASELHEMIGANRATQSDIEARSDIVNWFSTQIDTLTVNFKPFLQYKRSWPKRYLPTVIIACITLAFLSYPLFINRGRAENPLPQPTAAEVFHLRSECAALGQKILTSTDIGPSVNYSQVSHYEPQTNRCYVEVNAADSTDSRVFRRYLFDGQTGEVSATTEINNGKKSGMLYDKNRRAATLGNASWDDASKYIDAMMADDRKQ